MPRSGRAPSAGTSLTPYSESDITDSEYERRLREISSAVSRGAARAAGPGGGRTPRVRHHAGSGAAIRRAIQIGSWNAVRQFAKTDDARHRRGKPEAACERGFAAALLSTYRIGAPRAERGSSAAGRRAA